MSVLTIKTTKIKAIFPNNQAIYKCFLFMAIQLAIITIAIALDQIILLPAVIFGICFFYFSLRSLPLWIFSIFLLYILQELRTSGEISLWDIGYVVYAWGILLIWMVNKWLHDEPILQTLGDRLWVLFFVLCCFSVFQKLVRDGEVVKWYRELLFFVPYFLVFPFRESLIKNRKATLWAMGSGFVVLTMSIGIINLINYKSAAMNAAFAWELLSGRQATTEPLFVAGFLLSCSIYLYFSKTRLKILLLILIAFYALTLILTFSRGYWLGAMFGSIVMIVVLRGKARLELVFSLARVFFLALIVLFLTFGGLVSSISNVIAYRVSSKSINVTQDISLQYRYLETQTILQYISNNPIIGYGVGAKYHMFSILRDVSDDLYYAHNAYIWLLFKVGIIGLLLYMGVYLFYIKDAISIIRKRDSSPQYFISLGVVSLLVAMLEISLTSPQFYARDSVFLIVCCWAFIGAYKEPYHSLM